MTVVENNGQAKLVGMFIGNDGKISTLRKPISVVLFRTTETPRASVDAENARRRGRAGKAGKVDVVTGEYKLRKSGDFDLKKLAGEFSKEFVEY